MTPCQWHSSQIWESETARVEHSSEHNLVRHLSGLSLGPAPCGFGQGLGRTHNGGTGSNQYPWLAV